MKFVEPRVSLIVHFKELQLLNYRSQSFIIKDIYHYTQTRYIEGKIKKAKLGLERQKEFCGLKFVFC